MSSGGDERAAERGGAGTADGADWIRDSGLECSGSEIEDSATEAGKVDDDDFAGQLSLQKKM